MAEPEPNGIAVYCASSIGTQSAYAHAALSLGKAIAAAGRPLVYGGGKNGLMGVVSGAVAGAGGRVTGVVPYAFVVAGGEGDKTGAPASAEAARAMRLHEEGAAVQTVIVDSMQERKTEMAKLSSGFVVLPGGYGTWEELVEVVTWNQLGIHIKPIVVLNVLGYYSPLRQLIRNGIDAGLVPAANKHLVTFVDAPSSDPDVHEAFDWGAAALDALAAWRAPAVHTFNLDWTVRAPAPNGAPRTGTPLQAA